jgi:hypothetical protein
MQTKNKNIRRSISTKSLWRKGGTLVVAMWLVLNLQGCSTSLEQVEPASYTPHIQAVDLKNNQPNPEQKAKLAKSYGNIPLHFEKNEGQMDEQVEFLSRGKGYFLFLTPTEAVLSLVSEKDDLSSPPKHAVIRMKLDNANTSPKMFGQDILPGKTNYFIGNDPEKWRSDIDNYKKVRYKEVYPGIDLIYYGNQRKLEYDFVVQPGVDPNLIHMSFEGAEKLSLDETGNLVLHVEGGEVIQDAPIIYQLKGGVRKRVEGHYQLLANAKVGFQLDKYDRTKPLVIDPTLTYSTYLGGTGEDDGRGIAIDSSGAAYITGSTFSTNFPTSSAFQGANAGSQDVFITKLNAAGSALTYSTYLGGSGDDNGIEITVDSSGSAYITGETSSTNFPTSSAFQGANAGSQDVFITKLNAAGSALTFSTYLGGSGDDNGLGIIVDSSGSAYITGATASTNFPTSSAFQSSSGGGTDGFVTKFNAAGSTLTFSTYLGGSGTDAGFSIAVGSSGSAYITGQTSSTNFPTSSAFQAANAGGNDTFLTKFNSAGSALTYSTYLGGSGSDIGRGIAVDSSGASYITGETASSNFPTSSAFQSSSGGKTDGFVTKLNSAGSALTYSTLSWRKRK